MNLDKLLKKIELNKQSENEVKTFPLTIGDETYQIRTLTRAKKREFLYMNEIGKSNLTIGDIVKKSIPYIYQSIEGIKDLAERAKQEKLIVKYYDVIEYLFEPDEIIEIVGFMTEINNISEKQMEEDVEEIKKP
nr:MAG TPA: hypothetical protein [Caudoviricetes sp.]